MPEGTTSGLAGDFQDRLRNAVKARQMSDAQVNAAFSTSLKESSLLFLCVLSVLCGETPLQFTS
jgi:hypothetical protein